MEENTTASLVSRLYVSNLQSHLNEFMIIDRAKLYSKRTNKVCVRASVESTYVHITFVYFHFIKPQLYSGTRGLPWRSHGRVCDLLLSRATNFLELVAGRATNFLGYFVNFSGSFDYLYRKTVNFLIN